MINKAILEGRLVRPLELRYTQSSESKAVSSFTIAVSRRYKNKEGEREADFINCVIWGKNAENLANWTTKGSLISLVGEIKTRSYENQQSQRVYVTEILVQEFSVLDSRKEDQSANYPEGYFGSDTLGTGTTPNNNFGQDISDDDLPF